MDPDTGWRYVGLYDAFENSKGDREQSEAVEQELKKARSQKPKPDMEIPEHLKGKF